MQQCIDSMERNVASMKEILGMIYLPIPNGLMTTNTDAKNSTLVLTEDRFQNHLISNLIMVKHTIIHSYWEDSIFDNIIFLNGMCHKSHLDAKIHGKALISFTAIVG